MNRPADRLMPGESEGRTIGAARSLGALQLATAGCAVYSDPERYRKGDEGVGGILLEVVNGQPDNEGTIPRAFKVWDPWAHAADSKPRVFPVRRGHYLTVPEHRCGQDSITGFDRGAVTAATTQMALEYARNRGPTGRRMLVSHDIDLAHDLWALVQTLIGGNR